MLNLLCLTALSLSIGATRYQNDMATASEVKERCDILDFISADFRTFVDKYNEYHIEKLEAKELIRTKDLHAVDYGNGYYFDFDKGFMIATNGYEILAISNVDPYYEDDLFDVDGPLVYSGEALFSPSGFEFGLDAEDVPILGGTIADKCSNDFDVSARSLKIDYSDGIDAHEIDSYISGRYSDYSVVSECYLDNYDYICQDDTSIYKYKVNGVPCSEGNCAINASYSMLHNMGKKFYNKRFYYNDYYVDYRGERLLNDPHYSLRNGVNGWYVNDGVKMGEPHSNEPILKNMPNLYLQLREMAINVYGYSEDSGISSESIFSLLGGACKLYGYNDAFFYYTRDYGAIHDSIDNGIPFIITVVGSKIYENHAMSINGYMRLQRTTGWWALTSVDNAWILSVDDGRRFSIVDGNAKERRYYDTSESNGNLFTCADHESLEYSGC